MLSGKIAVITGASRGIGREIALTFAKYNATVVINYNGSEEKANEVKSEIEKMGQTASVYKANISNFDEAKKLIEDTQKKYGRIDILVNNAGITKDNLVPAIKEEDFDSVINTNLKGTFNCIKSVYRVMLKQNYGRIINMSSVVGVMGNAGQVNYSASKAGIIGMTKSVAKEVGKRNITVNAIAPGYIQTEMTAVLSDEVKSSIAKDIPLNRLGETKDIAETAAFLASDKASYITGQVIQVDGGLRM